MTQHLHGRRVSRRPSGRRLQRFSGALSITARELGQGVRDTQVVAGIALGVAIAGTLIWLFLHGGRDAAEAMADDVPAAAVETMGVYDEGEGSRA